MENLGDLSRTVWAVQPADGSLPIAARAAARRLFASRLRVAALGFAAFLASSSSVRAAAAPAMPTLADILAAYRNASADPDAPAVHAMEVVGTTAGAGLHGIFTSWMSGDRERDDESLGPRSDRTLRIGDRIWYADENGDVREFTGVLARRARTQEFVQSGAFAEHPERCVLHGRVRLGDLQTYALDVTQVGGDTETLYLDTTTFLPDELAYDEDDGRATIDYSDWHTIAGRRYAFTNVSSNGDHAFDTIERTTAVNPYATIGPALFAPLVTRTIAMDAPETVPLQLRDGHFYAPVTIGGKTLTFLVDTGAQDIVLDRGVAAQLGLQGVGALEASGASRTGGLALATLPQLIVGTRGVMRDLVVSTLDLGRSTEGAFRIDGVLGYPFFAQSQVRFDAALRTLTFGPPQSFAPSGARVVLSTDRAFPEATFHINDSLDAPFIIDTGNAGELLLYRPFLQHHPGIVAFSTIARHSYGIGGSTSSYRSSLDELDIAGIPLYHVDTDVMLATHGAFADRFEAGNVGLGVLDNFRLTFDLAHDAMYVERGAAFDDGRSRN